MELSATLDALTSDPAIVGRRVQAIWLFGSHARGDARADSDIDLAILCEPPLGAQRLAVMDRVGNALGVDIDLVDLAIAPPVLVWEIVTTGRLVLEAEPRTVEDFLRRSRFAAEDESRRLRMVVLAQTGSERP